MNLIIKYLKPDKCLFTEINDSEITSPLFVLEPHMHSSSIAGKGEVESKQGIFWKRKKLYVFKGEIWLKKSLVLQGFSFILDIFLKWECSILWWEILHLEKSKHWCLGRNSSGNHCKSRWGLMIQSHNPWAWIFVYDQKDVPHKYLIMFVPHFHFILSFLWFTICLLSCLPCC